MAKYHPLNGPGDILARKGRVHCEVSQQPHINMHHCKFAVSGRQYIFCVFVGVSEIMKSLSKV